ncbi:MAG: hypothetical protein D6808_06090 [Candidatus Dadabacteria bacterium]|nr:MAG: hypothetical protein D6808_06090 [Candidatus Dadabacteria bacterium]
MSSLDLFIFRLQEINSPTIKKKRAQGNTKIDVSALKDPVTIKYKALPKPPIKLARTPACPTLKIKEAKSAGETAKI